MIYKIRPALVVIDMQNCFVSSGGSYDKLGYKIKKYQRVIPNIRYVCQKAKSLKIPIFFSKATREKSGVDTLEKMHQIVPFKRREMVGKIPLCVHGTKDSEIIEGLKPSPEDFVVIKRRDSIFQDTEFEMWIKSLKINTLIFTGVDTYICVESSLRDAFNKGWDIILLSDATSSLNDSYYKTTINETKDTFGLVYKSKEFFRNIKNSGENNFLLKVK
jgi:ureidoacrylate peracid hydrolase